MLEETHDREELIERVAALDIGKAELTCCVRVPSPDTPGRRLQEIQTYATMTRSLLGMADRLRQLGVTRVVMEATSDYWRSPFYLLEAHGFEVLLVNAPNKPYIFCIFTKNNKDISWTYNNEAWTLARKLSALLWDYFEPKDDWKASNN